jgi:hypothetical protein
MCACEQGSKLPVDVSALTQAGYAKNPVGILSNGNNFCAATLLDNGNVLTANHCVSDSLYVRFSNPDGAAKTVPVKKVLSRSCAQSSTPTTLEEVLKLKDYALLDVGDASDLISTFGSRSLMDEKEMNDSLESARSTNNYVKGEFWLYRFQGTSAKLEIRSGYVNLNLADGIIDFFSQYSSAMISDTWVGPQNSGSPFFYNGKIYGVLTHASYKTKDEEQGRLASRAIITQALAIKE